MPTPNPNDLAGVVARVEAYLDTVRAFVKRDDACEMQDEPGYFATLDHADLRTLLAALAEARKDSERINWLEVNHSRFSGPVDDSPRWVVWADDAANDVEADNFRDAIDRARRTPHPETPE